MPAEPPDICAHCGADIHPNARACPQCGADESTGWEEEYAPDLGLDEDEFDYDEFVEREFGTGRTPKKIVPHGLHWFWWLVSLGLIAALLFMWV